MEWKLNNSEHNNTSRYVFIRVILHQIVLFCSTKNEWFVWKFSDASRHQFHLGRSPEIFPGDFYRDLITVFLQVLLLGIFQKKKLFEISLCVPYEFWRWLSLENPSEAFFRDSYLRLVRDFSENSICRSIQEFYLGISSGTLGGSPDWNLLGFSEETFGWFPEKKFLKIPSRHS